LPREIELILEEARSAQCFFRACGQTAFPVRSSHSSSHRVAYSGCKLYLVPKFVPFVHFEDSAVGVAGANCLWRLFSIVFNTKQFYLAFIRESSDFIRRRGALFPRIFTPYPAFWSINSCHLQRPNKVSSLRSLRLAPGVMKWMKSD